MSEQHQNIDNQHVKNWYDKSYKWLLLIPAIIIVISLIYMVSFHNTNHDFIIKDVSLTGGTTITVFDGNVTSDYIREKLGSNYSDISIRGISDLRTGKQRGLIIETTSNASTIRPELEKILGYNLTGDRASIEFSGAVLSAGFYGQLRNSIVAAFLLMALVVFLIFAESKRIKAITSILTGLALGITLSEIGAIRSLAIVMIVGGLIYGLWKGEKVKYDAALYLAVAVASLLLIYLYPNFILLIPVTLILIALYVSSSMPSFMVIFCAFADILMTITLVNMLGMKLSLAGIIAFLMLIGYSVDTDILLTTRLLKKKEGSVNARTWGAFKTGLTMTLTAIASAGVALAIIYNFSDTLRQIFTVITIGLVFDLVNTWITNTSLLRWYMEVKKIQ